MSAPQEWVVYSDSDAAPFRRLDRSTRVFVCKIVHSVLKLEIAWVPDLENGMDLDESVALALNLDDLDARILRRR